MTPIRAAFVMEQTLGHVTHTRNLREVAAGQGAVVPTWLPIPFGADGLERFVPLLRSNWSVRASWRARRALGAALAAAPHQAVFFHTQVTSLFSTEIMRRLPSVVSLDATPINYDSVGRDYGHRPAGAGLLDRQKYRMNRAAFQAAAALVSWSEWAKRSLVEDYGVDGGGVRVIAPGAAPLYFELGQQRGAGAASDGDGETVRLLFVGGDFRRKGGDLLLECLNGPLAERCRLDVVTQTAVEPRPNVEVHCGLGPNSPELKSLFARADLFILPSRADCLAVVLMEATAAGLPVITTEVGALPEAVVPGESGLLLPRGDGRALRTALEALIADAELRRRMGRAGHRLALRKFDARRNNAALLDLLVDLAQGRSATGRAA